MSEKSTTDVRQPWSPPTVTVYGDVERITLGDPPPKLKEIGSQDDFGVVGISDA